MSRHRSTASAGAVHPGGDRFPARWPVPEDGVGVPGELYDVPGTVIRDAFLPAEPLELELSVVELADGRAAPAVVLRREHLHACGVVDGSDAAGRWAYREQQRAGGTGRA